MDRTTPNQDMVNAAVHHLGAPNTLKFGTSGASHPIWESQKTRQEDRIMNCERLVSLMVATARVLC
jgi:hypothetical protein